MPFEEESFCRRVTQGMPFSVIAELLAGADSESRGQTPGLVIKANTQREIYLRLPQLLTGFERNNVLDNWRAPVTPLVLSQWFAGLSRFEDCTWREGLLKDTAVLIRQAPETFSTTNILSIFAALKDMQGSEGVRKILQATFLHLQKNIQARVWLSSTQISNILCYMKNLPDCEEARAIVAALTRHLNGNGTVMGPDEIAAVLYGLQRMPSCPEVEYLLHTISQHIQVNAEQYRIMSTHSLGLAFYGLQNMPDGMGVRAVLKALYTHVAHLSGQAKLDPNTACQILYGLKSIQDPEILTGFCTILANCFVDPPGPEQALNAAQLNMAFLGLRNMPALPATIGCYFRLLRHTFARRDQIEPGILSCAVYWLKNLSDAQQHPEVVALLDIVINRFGRRLLPLNSDILDSDIQERQLFTLQPLLSLKNIIDMIAGVQNLAGFDKILPVLDLAKDHLDRNADMRRWLAPDEIRTILWSLYNMHTLPQASAILESLQMHVGTPEFTQLGVKQQKKWLAEAIMALGKYWGDVDVRARDAALALIATTVQLYGLQLDTARLHQPLMNVIHELGQYMSVSGNKLCLDLRNCSVDLANVLYQHTLAAGQNIGSLVFLEILFYPVSALASEHEKAIYALLQQHLVDREPEWGEGKATISLLSPAIREERK